MSSAALMASQSSGALSRTARQCSMARGAYGAPRTEACAAHSRFRSAGMGTHCMPKGLSRSSSAFSPFPLSRKTRAYTRHVSRSRTAPLASSFAHIVDASFMSAASRAGRSESPAEASPSRVWSRAPQTAHMTCFGSLLSRYSFIAHVCCLTNAPPRAYDWNRDRRYSGLRGCASAAASNMATVCSVRPVFL